MSPPTRCTHFLFMRALAFWSIGKYNQLMEPKRHSQLQNEPGGPKSVPAPFSVNAPAWGLSENVKFCEDEQLPLPVKPYLLG